MDPKIVATVLTLLLLVFSARDPEPSDAPVQPHVDARQALSAPPAPGGSSAGTIDLTAPAPGSERQLQPAPQPQVPGLEPGEPATVGELSRVRSGPGTAYATLSKVAAGVRLSVLSRRDGWYQVRLPDGRVGWIAGFLLLAAGEPASPRGVGTGEAGPQQERAAPAHKIVGYYTEDYPGDPTSYGSLARNSGLLDYIAAFLHAVDTTGRVSGSPSGRAIDAARAGGAGALALVHNMTPSGFDGRRAHALLQTFNSRAQAVSDILDILQRGGYQGVNVDLENVYPSDRRNLTAFLQELAARLQPRGYLVTMSVPAKTADRATSTWVGAFDYYALGRTCDLVMLMTYDEHAWTSGPGPVASYGWVERVVRYAITQIPRAKILLGIPAYGYDWNLATGRVTALSYTQAMKRAKALGIDPSWDAAAKTPHFRYSERGAWHEVWFESSQSVNPKLGLVGQYGLGGIAIWRLGYEDEAFWDVIRQRLRQG